MTFTTALIGIVPLAGAGVALWCAWAAGRRRKLLSSVTRSGIGLLLLATAVAVFALALNLATYSALIREELVAELQLSVNADGNATVRITQPGAPFREFSLTGDEWQLDARVIKWQSWAAVLGADAQYRLERLSGRYTDVNAARSRPAEAYALSASPGLDIWRLARRLPVPALDTVFGSAVYMPIADGATYSVHLNSSGLVSRPTNDPARQAVERW